MDIEKKLKIKQTEEQAKYFNLIYFSMDQINE